MNHYQNKGFMRTTARLRPALWRFRRSDDDAVTVEFVIAFSPFVILMLLMVEIGQTTLNHFMLEHSLDRTARDVRIGTLPNPDPDPDPDTMIW